MIELLAAIPSIIYGIWGLFVLAPFLQAYIEPALIDTLGNIPGIGLLFAGPPLGLGVLTAGFILAIMVLPFIASVMRDVFETVPPMLRESAYGIGATTAEVVWQIVLPYTRIGVVGGIHAGARPRARRDHGGHLRHRQLAPHPRLAPGAGHDDLGDARQRVHRGGRRPLYVVADRARPHPLRHHLHRAGGREADADAARKHGAGASGRCRSTPAAASRNRVVVVLSFAATGVRPAMVLFLVWRRCCSTASARSVRPCSPR